MKLGPVAIRCRFTCMSLRKQLLLRRIVGERRRGDLTHAEFKDLGEILAALDRAIEAHEERLGFQIADAR